MAHSPGSPSGSPKHASVGPRPAGRRGPARDDAKRGVIVAAAFEIAEAGGLSALTMEAIAARAGVSKATIYKWWSHRADVALDGLIEALPPRSSWRDSGDFALDWRHHVLELADALRGSRGAVARAIIGAGQEDDHVRAAYAARFLDPLRTEARDALRGAQDRGELRSDLDTDAAIDLVYGAIYFRLLVEDRALTAEFVDALLDTALRGCI